jgi:hypothetical protein
MLGLETELYYGNLVLVVCCLIREMGCVKIVVGFLQVNELSVDCTVTWFRSCVVKIAANEFVVENLPPNCVTMNGFSYEIFGPPICDFAGWIYSDKFGC